MLAGEIAARKKQLMAKVTPARHFERDHCFRVTGEGRCWLVCFTAAEVCFYATDRTQPFMAEGGFYPLMFEAVKPPSLNLANALAATIPDTDLRFIPTTTYRQGRTGPIPVSATREAVT